MSGYTELRSLGVTFRPFDGEKPRSGGRSSPFDAGWTRTIELLANELRHLDAKNVVVELDLQDRDVRLDGMPRADARLASPAVRISFDSKWGPLRYETAEFSDRGWGRRLGWQDNVRAIALSMEALRKVDRYGVSKRGEQYRGWRQLMPGAVDPLSKIVTREDALEVLSGTLGLANGSLTQGTREDVVAAVKRAQRKTHPDTGGDGEEFRKVQKAKEILGV